MIGGKELLIPDAAKKDPNGFEILRVWIASKGAQVALRSDVWPDPAAWGILLTDLAKHVANSYEQSDGLDRIKTLKRIKDGPDAEFASATDRPSGSIQR
jgi:hypothetical protein